MELLLLLVAGFLAFSNGANDNFKGFATAWGSQALSYRRALSFATVATLLGSGCSIFFAEALVQQFSGKGLVPQEVVGNPGFILSVGLGAAATVMAATRVGLPVSTTHALIGGLVGAGLVQDTVHLDRLAGMFLMPLFISPLVAAGLGFLAFRLMRSRNAANDCACVIGAAPPIAAGSIDVGVARRIELPMVVMDAQANCDRVGTPMVRIRIPAWRDRIHTLSAASICFARGVNDTPKLVAILLAAQVLNAKVSAFAIALLMALGGLLFSRRVAETMGQRMTRMEHTQGLAANLISAALILVASKFGLPVSTTHVSVGSIAGAGVSAQSIDWATVRTIVLAWVATLPLAAAIAATIAAVVQQAS
jgi:inorganic phosphate transporter, PiT family